ncbi:MAG TPA: SDR family NAD(P)-dependent oxidoreductase, partial [Microthrixaceae bacterium]|nr:SDR family NAD(P)-dependent oxidoreductase [Microthrixaceae bacterium]
MPGSTAVGSRGIADGVVLVLGGRSEIGLEVARRLAPGRVVVLAARRDADLAEASGLVLSSGASAVHCVEFDADDTASHPALLERIADEHGPIGVAVVAFGVLGDQAVAERDPAHALAVVHTDFVAQVSVLTMLANLLRAVGAGQIVVFSSVAGLRVRRANYVYGSAKAGLDGFASGLG